MINYYLTTFLLLSGLVSYSQNSFQGIYSVGTEGDFKTLSAAADALNNGIFNGDITLLLDEGVYNENFILDSARNNGFSLTITSNGSKDNTKIFPQSYDNNYLSGFVIRNIDSLYIKDVSFYNDSIYLDDPLSKISYANHVVVIDSCQGLIIENVDFLSDSFLMENKQFHVSTNLYLGAVSGATIDSCTFNGAMYNISFMSKDFSEDVLIKNSEFNGAYRDINALLTNITGLSITGNKFLTPQLFSASNHLYIIGNTDSYPESDTFIEGVSITDNYFYSPNAASNSKCIYVQYFKDIEIVGNEILGGYYALFIGEGDSILVKNNTLTSSIYRTIESGGIRKNYSVVNNTFIAHNAGPCLQNTTNDGEMIIANNTFYKYDSIAKGSSYILDIDNFDGDSLLIANNLFMGDGCIKGYILLEYVDLPLTSPSCKIDYNSYYVNDEKVSVESIIKYRNVIVGDNSDVDSVFTQISDWQNFQSHNSQNSIVLDSNSVSNLPNPTLSYEEFIETANLHITNSTSYRHGINIPSIALDRDNDPRLEAKGIDIGADQYFLSTSIRHETCFKELFLTAYNEHENITSYKWYFGDGESTEGSNPTYEYEELGVYTISILTCDATNYCDSLTYIVNMDGSTCIPEEENEDEGILSISGDDDMKNIVVYPNPSNGEIRISSNFIEGKVDVELHDIKGLILYKKRIELDVLGTDISHVLSTLQEGVYIMSISNDEFNSTQKLLITH
ncbi:T9SS type A sorting domain-containing protein [Flammeovirga kamogawensis]|uniref:T9SS type A sorting domain-containing protein n=1 Tax=Flammeovirga kamogawensis TaxID=373891 RepID=A0ABX8H2N5_9BACT|nr:T9SS type A sorting domain-containing protein [Flammeovirga kamogawensis]MBB6460356.1 hypothetical protein [Flammeovirga kamogawensis]QWG10165.1 T9SS type A sorting domain-containing protein [Flammeovirga kamogawensis]TRX64617.1 T9SS type A sorting domain-containing protein [Flammeovirga kamogawensis]